ncbi:MAG TPA: polymer-forming cytoskeletal protein [Phnomibacter sp.]|nr:polymer-forming cytoskeletal protein [Phnomibacter sp.]
MIFQKKEQAEGVGSNDSTTIIAAGTRTRGDFEGANPLRIDGQITGNIACDSRVVIGSNGVVKGNITCAQADISGTLEGDIVVTESLMLRKDAVVLGNINARMLQMEPGVQFNGQCIMGAAVVEKPIAKKVKKEETLVAEYAA